MDIIEKIMTGFAFLLTTILIVGINVCLWLICFRQCVGQFPTWVNAVGITCTVLVNLICLGALIEMWLFYKREILG